MKDELGDRIKTFYEKSGETILTRRTPTIIRVDGRCFSGFCRRFKKPYDSDFHQMMNNVMEHLCKNIQGVKFAERHSDEISLLITDYDKLNTSAFFDYKVQKICSVVGSMATSELIRQLITIDDNPFKYLTKDEIFPAFDARCFNLPESEVENYFWWRMGDGMRNSINMIAQSKFSHKELQGKGCNEMQEMLFQEHGINWNDLPQGEKVGYCALKRKKASEIESGPQKGAIVMRSYWSIEGSPALRSGLSELMDRVKYKMADCLVTETA